MNLRNFNIILTDPKIIIAEFLPIQFADKSLLIADFTVF